MGFASVFVAQVFRNANLGTEPGTLCRIIHLFIQWLNSAECTVRYLSASKLVAPACSFNPSGSQSGELMATNPNFKAEPIQDQRELISVFDTGDETEAHVVQGLLETHGIESLLTNLDAPQDVLPGVGGIVLRVRPEDADEARSIIEEQRNAPPEAEESSETETS
jgi:hypothetical protein